MARLQNRQWLADSSNELSATVAAACKAPLSLVANRIEQLVVENRQIHERDCLNLNPATNTPNPRAESLLGAGLGSRPSLGPPADKYEMGLEAIEQIEIIAAELACQVFDADYAEIRVGSGALCNLYAFMACCEPGDTVIVPPAEIGGHVTHHKSGAAGLYRLNIIEAPISPDRYSVDIKGLAKLAQSTQPALITLGSSLNLHHHPVAEVRAICDSVGAKLLFDAAHLSGLIAGQAWPNPLAEGADLVSMSTYKSLAGPAGGLLLSNNATLMSKIDRIAFPGLTANFDASKCAALAVTLLDWLHCGRDYARAMVDTARTLAQACVENGLPVYGWQDQPSLSHVFALEAENFGGGQHMAKKLRQANILTCGIGLPLAPVDGDMNGLRIGTPELPRWGMSAEHMPRIASWLADALLERRPLTDVATEVTAFRRDFTRLSYIMPND